MKKINLELNFMELSWLSQGLSEIEIHMLKSRMDKIEGYNGYQEIVDLSKKLHDKSMAYLEQQIKEAKKHEDK